MSSSVVYYWVRDVCEILQDHKCTHGRYCPVLFNRYPKVNYHSNCEQKKVDRSKGVWRDMTTSAFLLHHHVWLLDFAAGKLTCADYVWGLDRESWEHFGIGKTPAKTSTKTPEDTMTAKSTTDAYVGSSNEPTDVF